MDSIRYDRTSLGDHHRDTTPQLAEFAEGGASFSNCISHGIASLTSGSSIITGTMPSYHRMGAGNKTLPDSIKTVPESLSNIGYETRAVSTNPWFSPATGLDKGFDEFHHLNKTNVYTAGLARLIKYMMNLNEHSGGYTLDMSKNRSEYLISGLIQRQLDQLEISSDPFFLYAHTEGVHTPYYPPKAWLDTFADDLIMDPESAREKVYNIYTDLYSNLAYGLNLSEEEMNAIEVMYDTLLRYIDHVIGSLLKEIEKRDWDPIIIITSDHGDLLGEKGLLSHKVGIQNGLLNVPLVIKGLHDIPDHSDSVTQHIDVMKTLCDLVGANTNSMHGVNLLEIEREWAVSQRGEQHFNSTINEIQKTDPHFSTDKYHSKYTTAIQNQNYKFVFSEDMVELFDLPDEKNDISDQKPHMTSRLRDLVESRLLEYGEAGITESDAEFNQEQKQRLKDLGYLED